MAAETASVEALWQSGPAAHAESESIPSNERGGGSGMRAAVTTEGVYICVQCTGQWTLCTIDHVGRCCWMAPGAGAAVSSVQERRPRSLFSVCARTTVTVERSVAWRAAGVCFLI